MLDLVQPLEYETGLLIIFWSLVAMCEYWYIEHGLLPFSSPEPRIDLFTDTAAILISIVSNSYYGMPRGQIHINLPPEHPIMSFETIKIKMAAVSAKTSIATVSDWFKNLRLPPVNQPMRRKTKTNCDLHPRFFPRFEEYTLFQNGRHLDILLFLFKWDLDASFKAKKYSFEF